MIYAIDTDDKKLLGLDYTDLVILEHLKANYDENRIFRGTLEDIGSALHLSKNQVFTCMKRMETAGVVSRYSVNPSQVKVSHKIK
jgi:DNA-binding Lrp family transcriptional regulator